MKFEIQVKFDIGDSPFMLYENKIIQPKIAAIHIGRSKMGQEGNKGLKLNTIISYGMEYSNKHNITYSVSENCLFETKEELLKSL